MSTPQVKEVFSPFDQRKVGEAPFYSKEEVLNKLDVASSLHAYDKRIPRHKVIKILENAIKIMQDEKEELIILATNEGGKPYKDSRVEIERGINGLKIAISHLDHLSGKEISMGQTPSSEHKLAMTFKEPIGVVASVSAFNHPFNLAIHQIIPAVAVGAPVMIKPATATPLSAFKIIEILKRSGLPNGYAEAILCDRDALNAFLTSPKVAFLSFIGSAEIGWQLSRSVHSGVRMALEHGGVAPVIVDEGVNYNDIIGVLAKGGFYHAGQVCVSIQRIYAHKSIAMDLAAKLADISKKLRVGDPLKKDTDIGPLIDPKEAIRINDWVHEQHGGEILVGGTIKDKVFYLPTVIYNPRDDASVSAKEVFGPVICVYPYEDLQEAVNRSNALDVSFQAAIFTNSIDNALYATKRLNATAVMVNDSTTFRVDWMPFGGAKTSGIGVGGINYSMDEMCNTKLMVLTSKSI